MTYDSYFGWSICKTRGPKGPEPLTWVNKPKGKLIIWINLLNYDRHWFKVKEWSWPTLQIKGHQAMIQTKFQTSEASGSEEEDFRIFSTYFYDSNLGLSFCTPPFEYIWQKTTRPCYILNFKIWAKWFWRRRFRIFFIISMVWTWDPLVQGHLGPRGRHLNKIGKGPLCNAT